MLAVQLALLVLCGARLWSAAAMHALGFEAFLALALFTVLSARIVRMLRRRL
jgi:hypothetical protein